MGAETRGQKVKARRVGLGMDGIDLARLAGVDRGRLAKWEAGEIEPRDTWATRVERALDRWEHEAGTDEPDHSVVRFIVRNVYGAEALVVEVPPENMDELEKAVDRIMRNLRGDTP